jgi:hypothetical protein
MFVKAMLLHAAAGAVLLLTACAQRPSPPPLVAAPLRPHQKLGRCGLTAPRLIRPHNVTAPTKGFWSKIVNTTGTRQLSV